MKLGWRGSRIWSVLCLSWAEMPAHRGSQCFLKACHVPASMLVSEEKNLAREEKLGCSEAPGESSHYLSACWHVHPGMCVCTVGTRSVGSSVPKPPESRLCSWSRAILCPDLSMWTSFFCSQRDCCPDFQVLGSPLPLPPMQSSCISGRKNGMG